MSTWAKLEDKLRTALIDATRSAVLDKSQLVCLRSKAARKFTLHPGPGRKFAAAEAALHKLYREKRAKGHRVKGHFLQIQMKRCVRELYGDVAALHFKASKSWLAKFAKHYNMSYRKGTNKKNLSVEERAGKCKRWHARFRRRLKRGRQQSDVWGRWLPQDRISLDQVCGCVVSPSPLQFNTHPCNIGPLQPARGR